MKKVSYLFLLSICSLKAYIQDVVVLKNGKRTIVFLHDYHWDDKNKSDAQEPVFKAFFNNLSKNALVHLETTKGPHTQKEVETYTKNNKDESCATIFNLQQSMFAGKKHDHLFVTKSFEVRDKEDTKQSIHIPYRIFLKKSNPQKELIESVQNWMKATITKTKNMLKEPSFLQLFSKKDRKAVVKKLSQNLKQVKLPEKAEEVYKISSVQVDITLLEHILQSNNQVQVVIGGRDHQLVVQDLLKTFKEWQQVYAQKGDDASVWGHKLKELIQT